jgi:PAS domain S-box-containing protein
MEVWTLWTPVYWLSGAVKFVAATASVLTAIVLPSLVPKALTLIHAAKSFQQGKIELEAANQALQREILDRHRREGEIQELKLELERRVAARTAQLAEANRSMAQMAAIVEHSVEAIVSLDLDGRITTWNAAAERLYEYGPAEILGRPVTVLEPAGVPVQVSALAERARGGEAIRSFETTGVRKSGQTFRMRFTLSAIRNEGGAVHGTSLIAREVPEQKRVEEMLRLTVEAAPNAMVMADEEGKIVLVNSQTEKLFGYPREELLGEQVDILVPHKYRGKHPAYRSKFMHEPAGRWAPAGTSTDSAKTAPNSQWKSASTPSKPTREPGCSAPSSTLPNASARARCCDWPSTPLLTPWLWRIAKAKSSWSILKPKKCLDIVAKNYWGSRSISWYRTNIGITIPPTGRSSCMIPRPA